MTNLRVAVDDYLAIRRTLGYSLKRDGHLLPDFVAYVEATSTDSVTCVGRAKPNGHFGASRTLISDEVER